MTLCQQSIYRGAKISIFMPDFGIHLVGQGFVVVVEMLLYFYYTVSMTCFCLDAEDLSANERYPK